MHKLLPLVCQSLAQVIAYDESEEKLVFSALTSQS